MAKDYTETLQTNVSFPDEWLTQFKKFAAECKSYKAAIHLERDPITNRASLTAFSDDDHGNGLPFFTIELE